MTRWQGMLWRFARGEEGQDLVEYAFLTLFIALASAGTLIALQNAIGTAYGVSTTAVDGLWEPPNPGGS